MSNYTPKYISFAKERMQSQGEEIRAWVRSDNSLLAQTCREIIEAAGG